MVGAIAVSMAGVRDHEELDVWKLCNELEESLAPVLRRAEFCREPSLQGQMIRASERLCPNIAEGFSRYYPRDNAKFVRIAKGSLSELIDQLVRARSRRLISADEEARFTRLARRARGAATGYVRYLESTDEPRPPSERSRGR
jgi:four helix bundle protein